MSEVREGAVELADDVFIREGRDVNDRDLAGKRLHRKRGRVEGPAVIEGQAAGDAEATRLLARHADEQMDAGSLVALKHPGHGALPAICRGGRGDFREHRVADPGLGGNALDRQDLGEPLGACDPHLVVLGVVHDERPSFDRGDKERGAGDARAQRGRGDHDGPAVAQHREEAPQPAVEEQVRLRLGG